MSLSEKESRQSRQDSFSFRNHTIQYLHSHDENLFCQRLHDLRIVHKV